MGIPRSIETRLRISTSLKGHEVSSETRKKISAACKGQSHGRPRLYNGQEALERKRRQAREYLARLKQEILLHYSEGVLQCKRCGITDIDVLCIDHINGGGNKHIKQIQKQGNSFYQWLKGNNYPAGYQVLCFNCNVKKRFAEGI